MKDLRRLREFKEHVKRIADSNEDEMGVTVKIDEDGFHLEVTELSDRHTFLAASSATLNGAIDAANLEEACEGWGYKYVE